MNTTLTENNYASQAMQISARVSFWKSIDATTQETEQSLHDSDAICVRAALTFTLIYLYPSSGA